MNDAAVGKPRPPVVSPAVPAPLRPPWLRVLTAILLVASPAALLLAPHLAEAGVAVLAIGGLYLRLRPKAAPCDPRRLRLLTLLTLGFFAAALATVVLSDRSPSALRGLWNLREFLAAPLLGLLLYQARIEDRLVLLSAQLGAPLLLAMAAWQLLHGVGRPGGEVNPLIFGILSLLLGFFSLVRLPLETVPQRALSLFAFACGCTAAVISQSRAVWLVSVPLLACLLWVWRQAGCLDRRLALGVAAFFLALAAMLAQTPLVQHRIELAVANYRAWQTRAEWRNPLGERLLMWRSGLSAAAHRPLLGWGPGHTQQAAASQLADPRQQRFVLGLNHLHNQYLNALVAAGVPGLLAPVLLLFVPLTVFLRRRAGTGLLLYDGLGALLCSGYALAGLTNQTFGDDTLNLFFVLFLSLTLPRSVSAPQPGEPAPDTLNRLGRWAAAAAAARLPPCLHPVHRRPPAARRPHP